MKQEVLWSGKPVERQTMLAIFDRATTAGFTGNLHCSTATPLPPDGVSAVDYLARIMVVFSGKLIITSAFDGKQEERSIEAGEYFIGGKGNWSIHHYPLSTCTALAVIFTEYHVRLVYSETQHGQVINNPYCHFQPVAGTSTHLLNALNSLLLEPAEPARDTRLRLLLQLLFSLLRRDIEQEDLPQNQEPRALVRRMLFHLQLNFHRPISCSTVCADLNISRAYASSLFHRSCGKPMKEYLLDLRLHKAVHLLRDTELSVGVIAKQCGFVAPGYFIRCFRTRFGMTPRNYRSKTPASIRS